MECICEGECECIDSGDFLTDDEEAEFYGESMDEHFLFFVEKLEKAGFTYRGCGTFRQVYERGNVVIKIPIRTDGLIDNRVEHAAYHRYWNDPTDDGILLAPCRLLPNGCLMMRKIEWGNADESFRIPKWTDLIDGNQVAPYKGRIVAYDYALNLTDRYEWEKEWGVRSRWFNHEEWLYRNPHLSRFLKKQQRRVHR